MVIFADMKKRCTARRRQGANIPGRGKCTGPFELCKHKRKHLSPSLMDKTKSRLAAFFDNDEDESSFPVRRIELFFLFLRAHYPFLQ